MFTMRIGWVPVCVVGAVMLGVACDDGGERASAPPAEFAGEPVGVWAAGLRAEDRAVRRDAMRALRAGGKAAIPVLGELLGDPLPDVRKRADEILGQIGAAAVPLLTRLATDVRPEVRYHAISVLGDLGRDSAAAVAAMAEGLRDTEVDVAREAGWALAALHEAAAPAVKTLAAALQHEDVVVRINAAGALASVGRRAAPAVAALIVALDDVDSAVRRSAAIALKAIGFQAAPAVERLTRALADENVYVRVATVGALGGIGPQAKAALPALIALRKDAALRAEVDWAVARISGRELAEQTSTRPAGTSAAEQPLRPRRVGEWPMLGGSGSRNAVADEGDKPLPESWDVLTGENIRWSAVLGGLTYGSPVVAGGRVFVGTDNARPRVASTTDEMGVLMAFRASDGRFLWQDTAPPLGRGIDEFMLPSTTSTPLLDEERLYYVTAQAQVRCLDPAGFGDGENDGPVTSERDTSHEAADVIWELDLGAALGVFPHEATNCSIAVVGDVLLICTGNGVDEAHTNVPAPNAPSFLGVDKWTGRIVWQAIGPGANVLHGQWSSPAVGVVDGRTLAFFGGGDGWLYALEAATGREVWRFDGNPKDAVWRPRSDIEGIVFRNSIVACPLFHDGRVYVAMGQDPEHGSGRGTLHAIDATGRGDVTATGRRWSQTTLARSMCTPVAHAGLLYIADYSGYLHCFDLEDGEEIWIHDLVAPVWGSLVVADGKVYVGDEDGMMTVARTGREKKILGQVSMNASIYAAPAVADGVMYVVTSRDLYAIAASN